MNYVEKLGKILEDYNKTFKCNDLHVELNKDKNSGKCYLKIYKNLEFGKCIKILDICEKSQEIFNLLDYYTKSYKKDSNIIALTKDNLGVYVGCYDRHYTLTKAFLITN